VLREIFTAEVQGDARLEARIRHLQTEVADLKAYTSALEEFLDQYGSGETVVDRLDDRLEGVAADLDAMAATVEAHDDDLATMEERLDRLDRRHRELADAFSGLRDALEDSQARLSALESRLEDDDVDERLSQVEAELEEFTEWKRQLRNLFS
jgi:chromosome segregation ATPase